MSTCGVFQVTGIIVQPAKQQQYLHTYCYLVAAACTVLNESRNAKDSSNFKLLTCNCAFSHEQWNLFIGWRVLWEDSQTAGQIAQLFARSAHPWMWVPKTCTGLSIGWTKGGSCSHKTLNCCIHNIVWLNQRMFFKAFKIGHAAPNFMFCNSVFWWPSASNKTIVKAGHSSLTVQLLTSTLQCVSILYIPKIVMS